MDCHHHHAHDEEEAFFLHIIQGNVDPVMKQMEYDSCYVNDVRQGGVRSPLMLAAKYNHVLIVKSILSIATAMNLQVVKTRGTLEMTALEYATLYGSGECAEVLIEHGSNPKRVVGDGNTNLHFAAASGLLSLCRRLISEFGFHPDVTNNHGETPTMLAAENDHLEVVEYLVEVCNADILKIGKCEKRAMDYAGDSKARSCQSYLKKRQQLIETLNPLALAARTGNVNAVKELLENPENRRTINEQDTDTGFALIHHAIRAGSLEVISVLLQLGVALDTECSEGTPLQMAVCASASKPYMEMMKILINQGNLNPLARFPGHGFQMIHFAAATGKVDALQFIITNYHADPNARGGEHEDTPLMVAAQMSQPGIISYLLTILDADSIHLLKNNEGKTALNQAQESQCTECIELLSC